VDIAGRWFGHLGDDAESPPDAEILPDADTPPDAEIAAEGDPDDRGSQVDPR
jgi:hypothetical protein